MLPKGRRFVQSVASLRTSELFGVVSGELKSFQPLDHLLRTPLGEGSRDLRYPRQRHDHRKNSDTDGETLGASSG